ncbi:MAG: hypothetical protein M3389_05150 [Actinomycetota bacterium]|nr:hypothetical protein [Actinomycetota bacterium]
MRRIALLFVVALTCAGCGTSEDQDEARAVVDRFYRAIEGDEGEAACVELGDSLLEQVESQTGQPCSEAITGFDYEPGAIAAAQVFVTNAKVDLRTGESAFLSREADGWKLSAIACKAESGKPADRPFECEAAG